MEMNLKLRMEIHGFNSVFRGRKLEVHVMLSQKTTALSDGGTAVKHNPLSRPRAAEDNPFFSSSNRTIESSRLEKKDLQDHQIQSLTSWTSDQSLCFFLPSATLLSLMVLEHNNQPVLHISINKPSRIMRKYAIISVLFAIRNQNQALQPGGAA